MEIESDDENSDDLNGIENYTEESAMTESKVSKFLTNGTSEDIKVLLQVKKESDKKLKEMLRQYGTGSDCSSLDSNNTKKTNNNDNEPCSEKMFAIDTETLAEEFLKRLEKNECNDASGTAKAQAEPTTNEEIQSIRQHQDFLISMFGALPELQNVLSVSFLFMFCFLFCFFFFAQCFFWRKDNHKKSIRKEVKQRKKK